MFSIMYGGDAQLNVGSFRASVMGQNLLLMRRILADDFKHYQPMVPKGIERLGNPMPGDGIASHIPH
jgi:hypothetical protein